MASITYALQRIKDDFSSVLNRTTIERICREHHHLWRRRELDPATTIALFAQQILHGNVPCTEVRHFHDGAVSAQAYCAARQRLPLQVCNDLFSEVCKQLMPQTKKDEHRWRGHRVFHVDGTSFSMPDTPELQKAFGMPSGQKPGCGFPVAHLLVLFSAQTGLLLDAWASPLRTGDLADVPEAHRHLDAGDILIGDDAYGTYAHLALLLRDNLHGLFPVHHQRIVDFTKGRPHTSEGKSAIAGMPRSRWIKSLGKEDQLVEYFKPREKPRWMNREDFDALPDSIVVRELRRTVCRPGLGKVTVTLVTTLLDPRLYPADELVELRMRRWDVETNIGHLKTTMKMDVLRCKSEDGVRKELAMFCLVYNLVRAVMLEASRRQEVPVSRMSFADTLKWMRHARPGEPMPKLIVVPNRPDRAEPRCKKRRGKEFDLMTKPRNVLRNRLKKQRKYV
jgi:Transposase DDE domain